MDHKILETWYKGKCHAPGIIEEQSEGQEEYETLSVESEDEVDLDLVYDELESIKRHLQKMRAFLVNTPPDPCYLSTEVPKKTFLTPKQEMLHQLRHSNSVLRCQMDSLVQRLMDTRHEVKSLEALRCQLRSRINAMATQLMTFVAFKKDTKHKFGLCIERDEQIKASKVHERHFGYNVRRVVQHNESQINYLAPLRCHRRFSNTMTMELLFMRLYLQSIFSRMINNQNMCNRRVVL